MPAAWRGDHHGAMHDSTLRALADARTSEFIREADRSRLAAQLSRTTGRTWLVRILRFRPRPVAVIWLEAQPNGLGSGLRPGADAQLAKNA
jgi:hypothetical protein